MHVPVLLGEVADALALGPGDTYLDCTAGLGGHASRMARDVGPEGTVILNDLDEGNLARARANVEAATTPDTPRIVDIRGSFAGVLDACKERGLCASGLLADLGFASSQVDDPARGFSFSANGPLDMRYNPSSPVTAADLVAGSSERELADLIREFGEDRCASRIARKIVEARATEPITTTGQLAQCVRAAAPSSGGGIDPATRTFQALRIAVNDEIGNLQALLASIEEHARAPGEGALAPGARIAVLSFHSLEDRPVKQAFARLVERGAARHVTRGAVRASEAEVGRNVRARSARLRAIALTGT